ncbi:MAG TPA: retropepsin-like aspartic protease [Geobacteraceae bacterium]|nr:retropepsin-like aspartic protease [Geobacteraceae bacterium]
MKRRRLAAGYQAFAIRSILLAFILIVCPLPLTVAFFLAAAQDENGNPALTDEQKEFYQYVDSDGIVHFADDLENIPRRYQNRLIIRKDRPAARKTTSILINDNKIRVPVSIKSGVNEVQATLLLDTGASITCITEEVASHLNIDPENTRRVSMGLADGSMVDIHVMKVDAIAVGDRMKSHLEIGILPVAGKRKDYDGYLGMDFLSAFPFRIDFQNKLIRWE